MRGRIFAEMETLSAEQLPVSDEDETIEQAIRLYGRTLALVDPSRLEAWVGLGLTMTQLGVLFLLRQEAGMPAGLLAERLRVEAAALPPRGRRPDRGGGCDPTDAVNLPQGPPHAGAGDGRQPAGHLHGRHGPDHRRHGAAAGRGRPGRSGAHRLG